MILDDKKRVIGKIVSINSDRFTVELLSGTKNFNVNGYDDIHYFAQINSYVIVPYQNDYIVSEVVSVREKDASDYLNAKEQELNKVNSVKNLDVLPVGIIKDKVFSFGVSVYPTLYSDVLYIKDNELDAIFEVQEREVPICNDCEVTQAECSEHQDVHKGKTRLVALDVGKSAIFPDYDIKINIDKFFGSHAAVLGNTGSGKSCTIASMIQTLYTKESYSAVGSTFFVFDVNGEYRSAFEDLESKNSQIKFKELSIGGSGEEGFVLPHHFYNLDEWELLLQASEKTQRPVLRSALGLASLFSKQNTAEIQKTKNHILATCISLILRDETGDPSKSTRIMSILRKFNTETIDLNSEFKYLDSNGVEKDTITYDGNKTVKATFYNALLVHYGHLVGADAIHSYLETTDESGEKIFFQDTFQMPNYDKDAVFEFNDLEDALDLALLYEEAYGNRHIRDYCSSLITRYKSIKERDDFSFIKTMSSKTKALYVDQLLGLQAKKKEKQVIILNLDGLEDELVEIVSSVLSRLIFDRVKGMANRNTFPVNLILEEAHRYISNDSQRTFLKSNLIFERIAKEGRKYGLFFLISSQRPSELSRTVLSQCNNFIVHRIQNPDDLSHIKQITPHISETTLKKLPSIPTQHALVFGSAVNIPTLFKVNDANPRPLSDNNEISKNWFIEPERNLDL